MEIEAEREFKRVYHDEYDELMRSAILKKEQTDTFDQCETIPLPSDISNATLRVSVFGWAKWLIMRRMKQVLR